MLVVLLLLRSLATLPNSAAASPPPSDLGVSYRSMGGGSCGEMDSASGASSPEECQRYCSVDPRCQFVTYVGTQCQWGRSCPVFQPGSGQAYAKSGQRQLGAGWFWAAADGAWRWSVCVCVYRARVGVLSRRWLSACPPHANCTELDLDGHSRAQNRVLGSGKMSVPAAMAACAAQPACSSFGLVTPPNEGPLSLATNLQVMSGALSALMRSVLTEICLETRLFWARN
jgi:hypothetical protein